MSNPVGWFEIPVRDLARAQAFYESMLGQPLHTLPESAGEDSPDMRVFPMQNERYGAAGALVLKPECGAGDKGVRVYFSCDDCAVQADKAQAAGGKVVQAKCQIGAYGFIALVQDTEGNLIGLHSGA